MKKHNLLQRTIKGENSLPSAKNQITILKLGGSIITEKLNRQPRIRKAVVKQLAKELKLFIKRFPKTRIILLHGAGSFGHPLVYRYKLLERPLTGSRLLNFSETVRSMRQMANLLTGIFLSSGLPVLPLQASAVLNEKNSVMFLSNLNQLKQIIDIGFIPLLGGDMSLIKKNQTAVVSADKLAVLLTKTFPDSRIIFATDVNGVFNEFPAPDNAKPIALLCRKEIESMLKKMGGQKTRYDITGAMAGKLRTMLSLQKKEIIIFNGLNPGNLRKALTGEQIGTRLVL